MFTATLTLSSPTRCNGLRDLFSSLGIGVDSINVVISETGLLKIRVWVSHTGEPCFTYSRLPSLSWSLGKVFLKIPSFLLYFLPSQRCQSLNLRGEIIYWRWPSSPEKVSNFPFIKVYKVHYLRCVSLFNNILVIYLIRNILCSINIHFYFRWPSRHISKTQQNLILVIFVLTWKFDKTQWIGLYS